VLQVSHRLNLRLRRTNGPLEVLRSGEKGKLTHKNIWISPWIYLEKMKNMEFTIENLGISPTKIDFTIENWEFHDRKMESYLLVI
jgi:hypothetical protein